jgi:hypothetical protein
MGSRDEKVRSWKLQTFNRPAVAVVLSRLIGTAEHDIIEPIPVDTTIALTQCGYGYCGKTVGTYAGKSATVTSNRRAHGVTDECFIAHMHFCRIRMRSVANVGRMAAQLITLDYSRTTARGPCGLIDQAYERAGVLTRARTGTRSP